MWPRIVRAAVDCVAMYLIVTFSAGLIWVLWQ
jgi:hypothetical protein